MAFSGNYEARLFRALDNADFEAFLEALANGVCPNAVSGQQWRTILISAVLSDLPDKKEYIQALLDEQADPNISDVDGMTPLHYSLEPNFDPEVVDLLLKYGADINAKTENGTTPLHSAVFIAMRTEKTKPLSYLLKVGAGYKVTNNAGETALDSAMKYKASEKIIGILQDAKLTDKLREEKQEKEKQAAEAEKKYRVDQMVAQRQACLRKTKPKRRFKNGR